MKEDKWALVTGASSGIGREFAIELGRRGYYLILTARRLELLKKLKSEIEIESQVEVQIICANLSEPKEARRLFDECLKDGKKVTLLINNAGRSHYGPFLQTSMEEYCANLELNINSLTKLCYFFTEHMLAHQKRSTIVNIGSIVSYIGVEGHSLYCGTKYYVRGLTESLNYEFRHSTIHFLAVHPGGTATEFMGRAGQKLKKFTQVCMLRPSDVVLDTLQAIKKRKTSTIPGIINKFLKIFIFLMPYKVRMKLFNEGMSRATEKN